MDTALLTQIAFAISLLINAALMVAAGVVLWRIDNRTTSTTEAVQHASEKMEDTLTRLQAWGAGLQGWGQSFLRSAPEALQAQEDASSAPNPDALDGSLQRVTQILESLDVARLRGLINDLDLMIRAMREPAASPGNASAPTGRSAADTSSALQQELEHLQARLNDATRVVYDLRRENRAAVTSTSALAALRQTNERLFAELKHRRERQGRMDDRLDRIQDQLRSLATSPARVKAFGPVSTDGEEPGAISDLQARLANVEQERARLGDQLLEIEAALGRTLREKDMIEDRFLVLSAERTGP